PTQQAAPKPAAPAGEKAATGAEDNDDVVSTVLPSFTKGESGPHQPRLESKMTQPPKDYTEASLLRGMETAGRNIDDDELRLAMKENGIGRPSTRAAIIETLFKRNYIRRDKKRILPTPTGIELIGLIRNPTLKSAELTGQWEKKLRQIERNELPSDQFLEELKGLVREMVQEVKTDRSGRAVSSAPVAVAEPPRAKSQSVATSTVKEKVSSAPASAAGLGACPACKTGHILRGKTAFGCARFREGCHSAFGCSRFREDCQFRVPFEWGGKKLTDTQLRQLLRRGETGVIKGFLSAKTGKKYDAALKVDEGRVVPGSRLRALSPVPLGRRKLALTKARLGLG
nr:hypothetical protein [Tanacetum cinerariifolium]